MNIKMMPFVLKAVLALSLLSFSLAGPLEDAVCGYINDLDALLNEFDQQVAPFDDKKLNKALKIARQNVKKANAKASMADLSKSFRFLKRSMEYLEKGAAINVSGSGFADDIASLGSFYAQRCVENLIEAAERTGDASDVVATLAEERFVKGIAARSVNVDQWQRSVKKFRGAIRALEPQLTIGPLECDNFF